VEAARLDPGLALHERARHLPRDAELVDVALDNARVVSHDRDEVARRESQPEAHVPRETGSLVDDHEPLAVLR
jgi:hypothetical protein